MSRKQYDKKTVGLEEKTFPKNKRWQLDQDYIEDLKNQAESENPYLANQAKEALDFMSKFNDEYYGGKVKAGDETALHNTEELRKDCYNRNNASNRDAYSIRECSGRISSVYEEGIDDEGYDTLSNNPINDEDIQNAQDNQIALLDYKLSQEKKRKDKRNKSEF